MIIAEFEEEFKKFTGAKYAVACSSGTSALHTALLALGIGKGDKVITTPFTFISTANAILYCGAEPVFVDIDPETYCLDPFLVEEKISSKVKAVLPVHLFGKTCDIEELKFVCNENKIGLVEDCAQAFGIPKVGTHGDLGCFSFYKSKNLWTFEGGMITCKTAELDKKCRMIINHGLNADGQHEILGFNYRMNELSALIGLTMLQRHKTAILSEVGSYGVEQGYYPYVIYHQPLYKKLGIKGSCPNAEKIAAKVLTRRAEKCL